MAGIEGAAVLIVTVFGGVLAWLHQGLLAGCVVPRQLRIAYRRNRPRPGVPQRIRRMVMAADRRRCVYCRSQLSPQLDHIVPWSAGGLTVLWNLAVLCGPCNRVKSNYNRDRRGKVWYRPFPGKSNAKQAELILLAELARRRNVLRWLRALVASL